jgi:hypothetical protein
MPFRSSVFNSAGKGIQSIHNSSHDPSFDLLLFQHSSPRGLFFLFANLRLQTVRFTPVFAAGYKTFTPLGCDDCTPAIFILESPKIPTPKLPQVLNPVL